MARLELHKTCADTAAIDGVELTVALGAMVFQAYALDPRMTVAKVNSQLNITAIHVTREQIQAMTLTDKIVALSDGRVGQVGKPWDPANAHLVRPEGRRVA